jgi:hypothetical protein
MSFNNELGRSWVLLEVRRENRFESSARTYLSPYNVTPPQNIVWPQRCSVLDAAVAATQQNWHDTGKGVPQSALICKAGRGRSYQAGKIRALVVCVQEFRIEPTNTSFGSVFFLASLRTRSAVMLPPIVSAIY